MGDATRQALQALQDAVDQGGDTFAIYSACAGLTACSAVSKEDAPKLWLAAAAVWVRQLPNRKSTESRAGPAHI